MTAQSTSAGGMRADRARVIADLEALVAIASLGGSTEETAIQEHLAQRWRAEGWQVTTWDIDVASLARRPDFPGMEVRREWALGVSARRAGRGGGRTLLLNAHTDVVPPGDLRSWSADPFVPRRGTLTGREVLIGRGTCDMKAGLVAAWEAVRIIEDSGLDIRGDIVMCPVSGEEDGGLGTYAAIQHLIFDQQNEFDACIIPEPTDLAVIPANAGALTFRLRVRGAAIHASRRAEGVSAIDKFMPILAALSELEARRNMTVDPLMGSWPIAYPLSIGTVRAGDWASTVPDLLIAEGRLGVALGESILDARAEFEATIALVCDTDPWLRDHPVEVEWWGGQFGSGGTDIDAQVVHTVLQAHERATGARPPVFGAPYGSDLRLLTGLAGIPTLQYGPGDSKVAHAPEEYVVLDDVITCAEVLAEVIAQYCG